MENHPSEVFLFSQRHVKHGNRLAEIRASRQAIADGGPAVQVQYRRQIRLAPWKAELGDVRHPLLVRPVGPELPFQKIRGDSSDRPPVGGVSGLGNPGKESELLHDPFDALVVHGAAALPELRRDAAVAVSPPAFKENAPDCGIQL